MKRFLRGFVAAASVCVLAGGVNAGLLDNGSFESGPDTLVGLEFTDQTFGDLGQSGKSSWNVFETLEGGWTTTAGAGIEVQTSTTLRFIDAYDGENYIELDSDDTGLGSFTNSTMSQSVNLGVGLHRLSFAYSPRTNDPDTNGIMAKVGDGSSTLLSETVTGPPNPDRGDWRVFTYDFLVSTAGAYDVIFTADVGIVGSDDELGGFLDAVNLTVVPEPTAFAVWSVLGVAGLATRRRRRS